MEGGTSGAAGLGGTGGSTPVFTVHGMATWRAGAKAAYAIVHDDACAVPSILSEAPALLESRDLRAAFAAIVSTCDSEGWTSLRAIAKAGHEVASNSWSHQDLGNNSSSTNYNQEIVISKTRLDELIDNQATSLFVFPFHSFNDKTKKAVKDAGYLGALAGKFGTNADSVVNAPNYSDDFGLNIDFYGPQVSHYGLSGPCQGQTSADDPGSYSEACRRSVLSRYVDDVLAAGGFGVRILWGIQAAPYQPTKADYAAHLDDIKARRDAGTLWVDTPSTILKYRRAREACKPRMLDANSLGYEPPSFDCVKYITVLSVIVKVTPPTAGALSAIQSGVTIPVRKLDDQHFAVSFNPLHGAAILSLE